MKTWREERVQNALPASSFEKSGRGGGGDGPMEARVAKLEASVAHIERDVAEVKTDLRDLGKKVDTVFLELTKRIDSNFKWTLSIYLTISLALLGVMAKGFGWLK